MQYFSERGRMTCMALGIQIYGSSVDMSSVV